MKTAGRDGGGGEVGRKGVEGVSLFTLTVGGEVCFCLQVLMHVSLVPGEPPCLLLFIPD